MTHVEPDRWHYLRHAAVVAGFSLPLAMTYGAISGLFAARAWRILRSDSMPNALPAI